MQPEKINPRRREAPLYEALTAHARQRPHPFHVPGHKQRASSLGDDAAEYFAPLLELDVTELADTDDLHHPQGPLAEAQTLAAACFGAEETRFLVGGSTSGNLAAILGLCAPDELMIVQRNVHKSIIHGLMLAGARAVLLPAHIDPSSGLATGPGAASLEAAIDRYPQAKAVILSVPNYYGMSPDLPAMVRLAHRRGIPVLVDEAHGPHFGLHPAFPRSALQAGADLVVQSAHKLLSAMTMGGLLHMQGTRFDREPVRQALRMVQSSSPSFPILASLDLARRQLDREGPDAFRSALDAVNRAAVGLADMSFGALGYENGTWPTEKAGKPFGTSEYESRAKEAKAGALFEASGYENGAKEAAAGKLFGTSGNEGGTGTGTGAEAANRPGLTYDPLKLVLFDRTGRWSGFELCEELRKRGCVAEMADSRYAVLAFGTGSMPADAEALLAALKALEAENRSSAFGSGEALSAGNRSSAASEAAGVRPPGWPEKGERLPVPEPVRFKRALGPSHPLPLEQSAGHVAAEWVIPYPPGIPVLYPGERITGEAIAELLQWRREGVQIQGAADSGLTSVRVVGEHV